VLFVTPHSVPLPQGEKEPKRNLFIQMQIAIGCIALSCWRCYSLCLSGFWGATDGCSSGKEEN
jgi:hypothetical protein